MWHTNTSTISSCVDVCLWMCIHETSDTNKASGDSFCETLVNLLGCSLWPIFMLLWVKSDLGITGHLSTAGLETHNYTSTAVCAHTHRLTCGKLYFSVAADTRRLLCWLFGRSITSMNRTACDCIFTSYFVLTVRSFPNKLMPITHQQLLIYIYIYIYIYKFNWITYN